MEWESLDLCLFVILCWHITRKCKLIIVFMVFFEPTWRFTMELWDIFDIQFVYVKFYIVKLNVSTESSFFPKRIRNLAVRKYIVEFSLLYLIRVGVCRYDVTIYRCLPGKWHLCYVFYIAMHVTELSSVLVPSYFCSNLIIEITS